MTVVIATGVNKEGCRELLGMGVLTMESETSWMEFIRSLVERGLSGMDLVISDADLGQKAAIVRLLPGSAWNRCYTQFTKNMTDKMTKKGQEKAAWMLRSVAGQFGAEAAQEQYDRVADRLSGEYHQLTDMLDEARE